MKRKAKQLRAQETARFIQIAAAESLIELGYAKSSTNKIAKKAGVSVGSIYQYFSGKDDIFESIVNKEMSELVAKLSSFRINENLNAIGNFQAFMLIGNDNSLLTSGAYRELSRQPRFRILLQEFAAAIQNEIALFLRKLPVEISDARLPDIARLLYYSAQSLSRVADEDGNLPPNLLQEFLRMVTNYVFSTDRDTGA